MALSKIDPDGLNVGQIGGRRNIIINGAMQVAQRGTQVTGVTTSGYKTVDRFSFDINTLGTWTLDQSTDSPNGFSNSFKMTCTTADASPATADRVGIFTQIEAQNLQSLAYGTSDAKKVTLSFWVKSNKTGTSQITLWQSDNSAKMYTAPYSISTADTWEYKTIVIAEDTSGVINNDNGSGLYLEWMVNSGATFIGGTADETWKTFDQTSRNASNLGVGGATNDYFQLTGVQLEVGDTATPFEHRSFGEELALCQRYFFSTQYANQGTSKSNKVMIIQGARHQFADVIGYRSQFVPFPVLMRAEPTVVAWNGSTGTQGEVRLYAHNGATQNFSGEGFILRPSGYSVFGYTGVSVGSTGLSTVTELHAEFNSEL